MLLALLVSPFRGKEHPCQERLHRAYLDCAIRHAVIRGYTPIATHKLYPDSLNDANDVERILGMQQRDVILSEVQCLLVYTDLGMSGGMEEDIQAAKKRGVDIQYCSLLDKEDQRNAPRSP